MSVWNDLTSLINSDSSKPLNELIGTSVDGKSISEKLDEMSSTIDTKVTNKVDKVTGKGLSTNDLTDELKQTYDNAVTTVTNKVDKVTGKGLSTNDLTNELKQTYDNAVTTVNKLDSDATVDGSVAQRIASIVANAPEKFDTLKEIAAWIESDTDGAAKMQSDIVSLSNNKLDKTGDSKDNTITFTSGDNTDTSNLSWSNVQQLVSTDTHASLFSKISQMFKNIRYLYKLLGTTDISSIGNGTVTGAISTLSSRVKAHTILEKTLTSSRVTYDTYNGRKLSDYHLLIFTVGASRDSDNTNGILDNRATSIAYGSSFCISQNNSYVAIRCLHGTSSSSPNDYQTCQTMVRYNSDTQVIAYTEGSNMIKELSIIGIKLY